MNFSILKRVKLDISHKATGNVQHYVFGRKAQQPSELQIVSYPDGSGYYLLYLDEHGQEITDTYHHTLEAAMQQATYEFNVDPCAWE